MIYLVYFLSVVERTSFRKNEILKMVKEYLSLAGYCDFLHKNCLFCSRLMLLSLKEDFISSERRGIYRMRIHVYLEMQYLN